MRHRSRLWVAVLVACSAPTAPTRPTIATRARAAEPVSDPFPSVSPFRLPHTFEPSAYRARLSLQAHKFEGHIEIAGELADSVSLIWLHGVDLVVTDAKAIRGSTAIALEASAPRADQLLGLRAKAPLPAGAWTISLDYSGPIRDQEPPEDGRYGKQDPPALGVFRRVVGAAAYVFTQSESIYARRIFPCIDEPDRKVPWQLTLDVDANLIAASNTPIVRETPLDNDRKRVEFAETLPLPSYLIAFAVGPFDVIDAASSKSRTPIRVLALHGEGQKLAVAVSLAPRILDLLEAWTQIPYPYGKLDLVTVPHPGWGAMENPGLVTFDQEMIEAPWPDSIIAHELAHQWFGDLVTPQWWDDLWLNESFASFMADKIDEQLDPAFVPEAMVDQHLDAVYSRGEARVRAHIASTDDLAFRTYYVPDAIHAGVSVLQLIEAYLGARSFQQAIHAHLLAHANHNAATADLVAALSGAAGVQLDATIGSLLDESVPILNGQLSCDGAPHLKIDDALAPLPVCVAYDKDGTRAQVCARVDRTNLEVPLPAKRCPTWVMPNAGGVGPYRTSWKPLLLDPLLEHGWSKLTVAEKQLVFGELDDEVSRLRVFVALARDGDAGPFRRDPSLIESVFKYVPDDLRPAFDAHVQAWFGARARSFHFKSPGKGVATQRDAFRIINLVAMTGDSQLVRDAVPLAAHYRDLTTDYFTEPELTVVANHDPSFALRLIDDLNASERYSVFRETAISALSNTWDLVGLIKRGARKLDVNRWEAHRIFSNVCNPTDRSVLAELLQQLPVETSRPVLSTVDKCILTKAKVEPLLRSWLTHA